MAFRIGNQVLAGELRNTRRNGVFGWLEFAPDHGVRIELTGNFEGELEGKHIRFKVKQPTAVATSENGDDDVDAGRLADRQIGVVGDMLLRQVKVPDLPIRDWLALDQAAQQEHTLVKDSLYLEWFSQNGRVVAEIVDVDIEFVDEQGTTTDEVARFEPLDDGSYGVGFTEIRIDEDGVAHTRNFELHDDEEEEGNEEDPYGLFDADLGEHMAESLGLSESLGDQLEHIAPDEANTFSDDEADTDYEPTDGSNKRRSWDEVIPGIDEETKALYEQWDEIFDGEKDEPVACLFETPLKLPKVENVSSEKQAESLVRSILAQLALLNVALDMCEHFSALETYRLLMEDILPTATVHPNLAASDMVLHYSTSDYCRECSDDFDAEYEDSNDNFDQDDEK